MDPSVREPLAAYPAAPRVLPNHTWEEYARWEGDWELIRGVPYSMSPSPKAAHNRTCVNLTVALSIALKERHALRILSELDWIVDPHTTIRPDVMVAEEPIGDDWLRKPPLLVAEVLSPATAAKDRIEKRALCEENRVPWFLLLDPAARTLEAFAWSPSGYSEVPLVAGVLELTVAGVGVRLAAQDLFGQSP